MSFFQPLPTPAYDVDVQVAVSVAGPDGAIPDACATLDGVYIQNVDGQGHVLGGYRPLIPHFAWGSAADKTMCAHAEAPTIGCVGMQRQTEAEYRTSLRAHCTSVRQEHRWDGTHYAASYLRVPTLGEPGTVNVKSGEVSM